jgi:hypothetical protein
VEAATTRLTAAPTLARSLTCVSTIRSPEVASTRSDMLLAAGTLGKCARRLRTSMR